MNFKSNIVHAVLSFVVLIAFIVLLNKLDLAHRFDLPRIVHHVGKQGKFAELTFLLVFALKPIFVVLPSSVFAISAGTLFGPVKGFVLNMVGFFLSATVAFFISRLLGKTFVERFVKGKLMKFDDNIEKNGFKIFAFLRFPPIFPYDIVSYAAGVTKVSYGKFILGSLVGIIPETICYSLMGKSIEEGSSFRLIIPAITMVVILAVTIYVFSKMKSVAPVIAPTEKEE